MLSVQRSTLTAALSISVIFSASNWSQAQENWPRFRGDHGTGVVADDPRLPEEWSTEKNVKWKADIPGRGWGSPVVWGQKVFLTAVTSDDAYEAPQAGLYLGQGRETPPDSVHHWWVYCLDLGTGNLLWKDESHQGKPKVPRHPKSTYAAETPVTDGEHLYVLFGDLGLYCYDLDGEQKWKREIEPKRTMYGYGAAASPVLVDGQVVIVYDNEEASYLAAFDTRTGELLWQVERDEPSTWATPLVWRHGSQTEIVVSGKRRIRSYSTQGDLLWQLDGKMSVLTIPSPLVVDDLLYVTSGYFQDQNRPVFAIKPGAQGDITLKEGETTNAFIAWSLDKMGPYNTSPIVYQGLYYTLLDSGMMTCHDAKTGELIFDRTRFPQRASFTSSPWAYNGKLFCLDENGNTYVIPVGREWEVEHINVLDELCVATPSIAQGNLLIRTASAVYCITRESEE
jgi:outer membrane protein assembly factor BamB